MAWETVVGLEVHAQLLTRTKIFCGCSTGFGGPPNTQVCPVCMGLPGALPVLNRKVVEFALMAALATNCQVARASRFARKNYFYPDLPKGYQISQYELPITERGYVDILSDEGSPTRIGITRIHMEEDAGKLLHPEAPGADYSLVDLNRACVPLLEIVSEPDIRSPKEASRYARKLREILVYLGICDGNMNEGSLRVDANVSVRSKGELGLGTRTEIKNVNSFRFLEQALEYERDRQIDVLEEGGRIVQETRLFDAHRGITLSMRSKEEAHDYRYFPDPDLLPLVIEPEWVEEVRRRLPELPDAKRHRFGQDYALPEQDTELLCQERQYADLFEEVVRRGIPPKPAANWLIGYILPDRSREAEAGVGYGFDRVPDFLTGMQELIDQGVISANIAKNEVVGLWSSGKSAQEIVREKGLAQISDAVAVERLVDEVIAGFPREVEAYRGGKAQLHGFFVGQVMKKTQGKANPTLVNQLLKQKLGG
jgi:aspartyl-tRNA(Asn)/glutamyl-tRNA(Gln) amidotransferase subunit B